MNNRKTLTAMQAPEWLQGRRRRHLFTVIQQACEASRVKLAPAQIPALCGFAAALEYAEILIRIKGDTTGAGAELSDWCDSFGVDDDSMRGLMKEVGALKEKQ